MHWAMHTAERTRLEAEGRWGGQCGCPDKKSWDLGDRWK